MAFGCFNRYINFFLLSWLPSLGLQQANPALVFSGGLELIKSRCGLPDGVAETKALQSLLTSAAPVAGKAPRPGAERIWFSAHKLVNARKDSVHMKEKVTAGLLTTVEGPTVDVMSRPPMMPLYCAKHQPPQRHFSFYPFRGFSSNTRVVFLTCQKKGHLSSSDANEQQGGFWS